MILIVRLIVLTTFVTSFLTSAFCLNISGVWEEDSYRRDGFFQMADAIGMYSVQQRVASFWKWSNTISILQDGIEFEASEISGLSDKRSDYYLTADNKTVDVKLLLDFGGVDFTKPTLVYVVSEIKGDILIQYMKYKLSPTFDFVETRMVQGDSMTLTLINLKHNVQMTSYYNRNP